MTSGSTETDDSRTGVPLLRTWRSVYAFVLGTFVAWVLGLALLSWLYA